MELSLPSQAQRLLLGRFTEKGPTRKEKASLEYFRSKPILITQSPSHRSSEGPTTTRLPISNEHYQHAFNSTAETRPKWNTTKACKPSSSDDLCSTISLRATRSSTTDAYSSSRPVPSSTNQSELTHFDDGAAHTSSAESNVHD